MQRTALTASQRNEIPKSADTLHEIAGRLKQLEIIDDDEQMHIGIAIRHILDAVKELKAYSGAVTEDRGIA